MTTVLQIQTIVAAHYGVRLVHLRSRDRTRNVAWCRHVSMYFARKLTNLTLTAIGNGFERDHGTVMHAIEQVENTAKSYPAVQREIDALAIRFNNLLLQGPTANGRCVA